MFADPTVFNAATGVTAGSAQTYNRVGDGLYLNSAATLDEPIYMAIQNTIAPAGTSSFVMKFSWSKNAPGTPNYGAKTVDDDISSIHVVVRQTHRAHDAAFLDGMRGVLVGAMYDTTLWTKFKGGQR